MAQDFPPLSPVEAFLPTAASKFLEGFMLLHHRIPRWRIPHWVIWWLAVGLIFAAVTLVNILIRHLARPQEEFAAALCLLFWLLSGVLSYAIDDARTGKR
jgi:hypothetical protein